MTPGLCGIANVNYLPGKKLPVEKEGDHLLYSLGRKHLLPGMHMARHGPEREMAGEMQQP